MLNAILGGEQDAAVLAELARGRLRAKLPELRRALDGRVKPYHLTLITRILAHIDFLEESLAQVQEDIAQHLASFEEALALVRTIPGCKGVAAATIVAEIGVDMGRFPSAAHLASWAGVCPGNKQSGGRRLIGRMTKGNPWLRAVLGEAAWAAIRTKGSYFRAQYQAARQVQGRDGGGPQPPGRHLPRLGQAAPLRGTRNRLLRSTGYDAHRAPPCRELEQLGYKVELTPATAA